jgi:hypothetical protein
MLRNTIEKQFVKLDSEKTSQIKSQRKTLLMDEGLRTQLEIYLSRLEDLIRRGRRLLDVLAKDPPDESAGSSVRLWQGECGIVIHELSGGSKAHWLSRAFSEAFLLRSSGGHAAEGAAPEEIVQRLVSVLEQAVGSLSKDNEGAIISASSQAPPPRRFDFVHNVELRPVLEQAYIDSRSALDEERYEEALRTSCGILEAIITDALEDAGPAALSAANAPGDITDWSFETRLGVAEKAGLVRSGWARLPAAARRYRDHDENHAAVTSERDARLAGQVLHVVMRDLNPGR